jgi:hypothetical protein
MLQESFAILKRNLNIILNAKISFLIIFLGPVFLMLVAGAILQDTSLKSLDIGVYTSNPEDLTEDEFLLGFQKNLIDGGSTIFAEDTLLQCTEKVLRMEYHACVEIAKNEEYVPIQNSNLASLDMPSYTFNTHVDYSQTASAWKIISEIQIAAETKYSEMTQERIKVIIGKVDGIISQLEDQRNSIILVRDEMRNIRTDLQNIRSRLGDTQNKLNLINQEVNNIKNRLNQIDSAYPEGIVITNQIRNSLSSIENNLNLIEEDLDLNLQDIQLTSERVDLEGSLTQAESDIGLIISDWNQLKQTQLSQISNPVVYKSQSLSGSKAYNVEILGFIDYLFPTFLMFFMIFVCLIFPTNLIIRERVSNSQIRNMTSKTSGLKFGVNNFISCVLVIITQVIILLLISNFFLNANIFFRTVSILILVVISVCILSLFGIILGYTFNKFEGAIIASVSASILMLILLPGITPTNLLPTAISPFIKNFLPVILENKLRTLIIFGAPLSFSFVEILSMLLTTAFFILAIILLYNKSKREI